MQLAPRNTGPPSPLPWASVMRSFMRAAISLLSSVSPSPPGMSMTLCAAPRLMISSASAGTCGAPMATMNKSRGPGSSSKPETQRMPEESFPPSRTMTTCSGSKPAARIFSRIIRPKLRRVADTPTMPMFRGCRSRSILPMGRSAERSPGREKRHMPSSGTMR